MFELLGAEYEGYFGSVVASALGVKVAAACQLVFSEPVKE